MTEAFNSESTAAHNPLLEDTQAHAEVFVDEDKTHVGQDELPSQVLDEGRPSKARAEVSTDRALGVAQVLQKAVPGVIGRLGNGAAVKGDVVVVDGQVAHELNVLARHMPLDEITLPSDPNDPDAVADARVQFIRDMLPRTIDSGFAPTLISGTTQKELELDVLSLGHATALNGPTAKIGMIVADTHRRHVGVLLGGAKRLGNRVKQLLTPRASRRPV